MSLVLRRIQTKLQWAEQSVGLQADDLSINHYVETLQAANPLRCAGHPKFRLASSDQTIAICSQSASAIVVVSVIAPFGSGFEAGGARSGRLSSLRSWASLIAIKRSKAKMHCRPYVWTG